ncbi:MAG TPA: glycosyltransferase family 39 protein [Vicinamibacterales bacterium]|nr:glycosyltransferase family 39 protein [Vicinamibacterales bacterium]
MPRSRPQAAPVRQHVVAGVLVTYVAAFTLLAAGSGVRRSATVDEPTHLIAGYAALTAGDYRLDPSHPPLVRSWAALALLAFERPDFPSAAIDRADPHTWLASPGPSDVAREFLYSRPDPDGWLNAARFMIVVLGLGLGLLVFFWAREWLGFPAAVAALACYTLSPGMLAHSALVTTDVGEAVFIFAAVYLLWRTCRRPTWPNALGLSASIACAVLTKFSGLVLGPMVVVLLFMAVRRRQLSTPRALALVALIAIVTVAAIWTAYGWRYAPSASPGWVFDVPADAAAHPTVPFARVASWLDAHRLLPNAFTQGLLSCAIGSVQRSYLLGQISDRGWWYYFPVALLVKTPVPLLVLVAVGLAAFATQRSRLGGINETFVLLPAAMYMVCAIASGINIGVRHILPLYPFFFLIAGLAVDRLWHARRRVVRVACAGLLAVWIASVARTYPSTLSFFNLAAGGPTNGLSFLADSNLDWGQGLKQLKVWMDDHGISHINLAYFGEADPRQYRIDCTYLPSTLTFASRVAVPPRLPGFVAISATVLSGVYLDPQWRVFYSGFRRRPPAAEIGHSIRVYWVDHWPDADDVPEPSRRGPDPDVEASLAEHLLFKLRWPRLAAAHYRHYLRHRPNDANAVANYGTALEVAGDPAGGLKALEQAVALSPRDGSLHVSLGHSLLAAGRLLDAETQARQALALNASDPSALDLLGRALALQARFADAVEALRRALAIDPDFAAARADLERVEAMRRAREGGLRPPLRTT